MTTNPTIPDALNNWDVEHDPFGYVRSASWCDFVEPVEDVLQLHHVYGRHIIDVGHYGTCFVVMVIKDSDWESPIARVEVGDKSALNAVVNQLVDEYVNPC